jgi:hypothetical protein
VQKAPATAVPQHYTQAVAVPHPRLENTKELAIHEIQGKNSTHVDNLVVLLSTTKKRQGIKQWSGVGRKAKKDVLLTQSYWFRCCTDLTGQLNGTVFLSYIFHLSYTNQWIFYLTKSVILPIWNVA